MAAVGTSDMRLRVEKLLWRGRGLARRQDGKVVILEPGVLPTELVLARIKKSGRDYEQAEVRRILEPHPARRQHPCGHWPQCGGCRFGIVDAATALALKLDILADALNRAGLHLPDQNHQSAASPENWRYRYRAQVHVAQGKPHFKALESNVLIPLNDCLLLAPDLAHSVHDLCSSLPDGRTIVACSPLDGRTASQNHDTQILLPYPDLDLHLQVPAACFFQANWNLNLSLVGRVRSLLGGYQRILDLYAGSGNFAVPLACEGARVLAVEQDVSAVDSGTRNARRLGLDNLEFRRLNLRRFQGWDQLAAFAPQGLVVDPPRSGGPQVASGLAALSTLQRMVWISCDIVNTCRDLVPVLKAGWKVRSLEIFDMFPQTWHMEVLLVLERSRMMDAKNSRKVEHREFSGGGKS